MKKEALTNPIQPDEIEWRIQSTKNGHTTIVPYITNRCVMDRLDEAFGFDGWSNSFTETTTGFICRITVIRTPENNITIGTNITVKDSTFYKEDGADKTKIEATKGGISDSMKRCAVHFGIGRGLYNYPRVRLKGEHRYIEDKTKELLNKLVTKINSSGVDRKLVTL